MSFDEVYNELKALLEKNDYTPFGSGIYSYEFDITGEGKGKFYMEIRDGAASIQPYDYKGCTCCFRVSSHNVRELLNKTLDPISAYSTGRLKINGDISAAFRLADSIGLNF